MVVELNKLFKRGTANVWLGSASLHNFSKLIKSPLTWALYAKMNQPYRVRIKTKVKVRLALILILFIVFGSISINYILQLDFGITPKEVKYGRKYQLEALKIGGGGSYRGSTLYTVGRFKLPNGKIVSAKVFLISHNKLYCVSEVLVNGKVKSYLTLPPQHCV